MKDHSGKNKSVWVTDTKMSQGAKLSGEVRAEVCIIGAGIAGLSTAYLLAREERQVAVLEADRPGTGQTARTTAHLGSYIDDGLTEVERVHGVEGLRLAIESHAAAIDRIEAIVQQEKIDCGFRRVDAYLFLSPESKRKELEDELAAAHRAGWTQVELLESTPVPSLSGVPCLRIPNQAEFHPLKYLSGLRDALGRMGAKVYTGSQVIRAGGTDLRTVETASGAMLIADKVVVATNSPITNRVQMHTKRHPYVTYVVGLEAESAQFPEALYWDTSAPYHYVRLTRHEGRNILIVGGEDHKTGQGGEHLQECYDRLESWARERFPGLGARSYHWSGQVMETLDGLGYIGLNPLDNGNVFIATGDSGMGMTHGTIAGILITDLIQGRSNPWTSIYDPARKPMKTIADFVTENANMAFQYRDYVTGSDVLSIDEIPAGQGAVIREGLAKVAVYRDKAGKVHRCSAVCPHLGAIVRWNNDEKTWDCPAHGSRFAAHGECIQGAAYRPLAKVEHEGDSRKAG